MKGKKKKKKKGKTSIPLMISKNSSLAKLTASFEPLILRIPFSLSTSIFAPLISEIFLMMDPFFPITLPICSFLNGILALSSLEVG